MADNREEIKACGRPYDTQCIYGDWDEKCICPRKCEYKYEKIITMKNDLTPFEKDLIKHINLCNRTKYNWKNLMEWGSEKERVEKNLREGELIYEALGVWIAIKPNAK